MRRIVQRVLPDGTIGNVQPFHIYLEGLEKAVLCRDDKDYDAFVKIICLAARRKNVIVVIYVVVSNHSHATVLARCQDDADSYGEEVKKMASMWVSGRYGERKLVWTVTGICAIRSPMFRATPWTMAVMSTSTVGPDTGRCSGAGFLPGLQAPFGKSRR